MDATRLAAGGFLAIVTGNSERISKDLLLSESSLLQLLVEILDGGVEGDDMILRALHILNNLTRSCDASARLVLQEPGMIDGFGWIGERLIFCAAL